MRLCATCGRVYRPGAGCPARRVNSAHIERRALLKALCAGIADDDLLSDKRKRDMRRFYRKLVDDTIRASA